MKFTRRGTLAIDPTHASVEWDYAAPAEKQYHCADGVATITIRGPLSHHPDWYFESYDEIVERVRAAHADPEVRVVYITGDSPGGEVGGCFSSARIMRRIADESGKPMIWYVDGQTCSAALALAMACDRIVLPPEARFGSIGVIAEVQSFAEQAARSGVDVRLITSGARKADGHPLASISDETVAAIQEAVDRDAEIFWGWVSERTTIPVATISSWQAAVFHGQQAIDLGLADAIADDFSGRAMAAEATKKDDNNMPGIANNQATTSAKKASLEEARKMLGELASDDSDEGRAARKMLDASDAKVEGEEEPEHKEPDGDEASAADDEPGTDAADDSDDTSAEDKSDEEQAKAEASAAKACRAAAAKAETEARAILRTGAKDCAKRADAKLAEADRLRAKANDHSRSARIFESNARTQALAAKAIKRSAVVQATPAAALAGTAARGTAAETPVAKATAPALPPYMLRAAGLGSAQAVDTSVEGIQLGAISPEQANEAYGKLQAQIKAVKEGK
jgi:ClpP class serine protease